MTGPTDGADLRDDRNGPTQRPDTPAQEAETGSTVSMPAPHFAPGELVPWLSALDGSLPQDSSPLEGATLPSDPSATAAEHGGKGRSGRQTREPAPLPGFNLGFLEDQWDDDQASRHIGVEIRLLELDHAVFSLKITEHLVNGHGIVHGGYIFTLADTTFAYACNSRGLTTVAAGVDITFVQAAYLGDVLVADARVRANWGRSGITDVQVTRESDGALVAEFRGRSRQIPPKATPTALA